MQHLTTAPFASVHVGDPAVAAFLLDKDVKPHTRAAYRSALDAFLARVPAGQAVTPELVRQYRDELLASGNYSPLSVASYLSAVRTFFSWAVVHGLAHANPAAEVKAPKAEKKFRRDVIPAPLARVVLDAATDTRARLIAELMLRAGLRGCEVVRANLGDRQVKQGRDILNVQGKGRDGKDKFVVLAPQVVAAWDAYLQDRGPVKAADPLFVGARGSKAGARLTTRTVRTIVNELLVAAKVKEKTVTTHSLRHTCAVELLRAGASWTDVQGVLRHASVDTTAIYGAYAADEVRLRQPAELLLANTF